MTLRIHNITLYHHDMILLDSISLSIYKNKTTILLGKSGSGKTLTTLAIQGLLPPYLKQTSGEILLNDVPILPQNSVSRIFASIMQNPKTCFNPLHSIESHFRETLDSLAIRYDKYHIKSILQEVNLPLSILTLYPFELSGGMLQRVMIAIALLTNSPFLIADEPTTDLDLTVQYKILTLLKQLQKTRGLGILLITHDLDVAIKMADYIVCIENGKIVQTFDRNAIKTTTMQTTLTQLLQRKMLELYPQ